jgi:hypothetical protein
MASRMNVPILRLPASVNVITAWNFFADKDQ